MIGVQLLLGLTLWLKGADEAIIQLRIPPSNWPQRIWTPSLIQELHRAYQERLFAFFLWDENLSFRLFHSAYLGHFQQENQRRQVASFALRRFMEYHIEQVIREKPSLKPVVETKQKIENWQVQLPKNIQIKMSYQLTTNELHLIVENLGFDQWRYRGRMDPQKWGPGPFLIQEWWLINHMANRKWLLGFFGPNRVLCGDLKPRYRAGNGPSKSVTTGSSTPWKNPSKIPLVDNLKKYFQTLGGFKWPGLGRFNQPQSLK